MKNIDKLFHDNIKNLGFDYEASQWEEMQYLIQKENKLKKHFFPWKSTLFLGIGLLLVCITIQNRKPVAKSNTAVLESHRIDAINKNNSAKSINSLHQKWSEELKYPKITTANKFQNKEQCIEKIQQHILVQNTSSITRDIQSNELNIASIPNTEKFTTTSDIFTPNFKNLFDIQNSIWPAIAHNFTQIPSVLVATGKEKDSSNFYIGSHLGILNWKNEIKKSFELQNNNETPLQSVNYGMYIGWQKKYFYSQIGLEYCQFKRKVNYSEFNKTYSYNTYFEFINANYINRNGRNNIALIKRKTDTTITTKLEEKSKGAIVNIHYLQIPISAGIQYHWRKFTPTIGLQFIPAILIEKTGVLAFSTNSNNLNLQNLSSNKTAYMFNYALGLNIGTRYKVNQYLSLNVNWQNAHYLRNTFSNLGEKYKWQTVSVGIDFAIPKSRK